MRDTRQARKNKGNRIAFGILVIIVSLFCFLCEVRAFANVGKMVYGFLVGFFGLAAYAYSIMGIIAGVCITFGIRPKLRFSSGLLYFGMFLLAVFALHVYTSSAHILGAKYGEYLMRCYDNTNTMGGMLFGVVAFPLMKAVTTIGALVIAVAAFFALVFLAILPSLKRNVVYTAYSKEERQRVSRQPKPLRKQKPTKTEEAPRAIDTPSSPVITDFSKPSGSGNNLFVVNVAGDPLQTNKKAKGADGYQPLYPNATGGYEDERRATVRPSYAGEGIYSPQNLARSVLFARDEAEAQENLRRFNTVSNPNSALNNFGGPSVSSTSRRSDLRQRLGIDDSASAFREEYLSRYNLREDVPAPPTTAPQVEEQKATEPKKEDKPYDFKLDFATLREEQIKSFGTMYAKPEFEATAYENPTGEETLEAEVIKKEVVKPTRTRSDIDGTPTVQKAETAVEKQVNVGLQGALNRTMSGL